jgi:hypothetical protein
MQHRTGLSFFDEFRWVSPFQDLKKRVMRVTSGTAIFTLLLRRRVAFLHHPATCQLFQTISIIAANLQDNRVVFRIFITLLRFSFDSPYNKQSLTPAVLTQY